MDKNYISKLRSSLLTEKEATKLGMRYIPDVGKLIAAHKGQTGIQIPYHDAITRKPNGFYRIRLLTAPHSFAADAKKPQRYVQPANTGVAAYFPLSVIWSDTVQDDKIPIYITEGEFKAACACKYGYPCIGLGGVYSWRSAKNGVAFLPELEMITLENRKVYIVFDSDAQSNPNVMKALLHLCGELTGHGAVPFIVKLPQIGDNGKTGLDDLIKEKGIVPFNEAINFAVQYDESKALWELNDEVVYIRHPGFVYDLNRRKSINTGSFQREVFADRHYDEQVVTAAGGTKLVRKQTAIEWIKWPHRREADEMTYAPGQPRFFGNKLNAWEGYPIEPKVGNTKPWKELLDYLFKGGAAERAWFEKWCAWPLQHPENPKMLTAVILWGRTQGTGKTLVAYSLREIYGKHNFSQINSTDLHDAYNSWAVNRQFVLGEEITSTDKRGDADKIKSLITGDMIRVNVKFIAHYDVPSLCNFLFTSNHPDAFYLEDTDRRFFVWEINQEPLSKEFYAAYDKWKNSKEGAQALFHHLLSIDLTSFDPRVEPPVTASKMEMIEAGKSDHALWIARLKENPNVLGSVGAKCDLYDAPQLLTFFDPTSAKRLTVNGMARELKRSGITRLGPVNVRCADGSYTVKRFYALRNTKEWAKASPKTVADHWLEHFGGKK